MVILHRVARLVVLAVVLILGLAMLAGVSAGTWAQLGDALSLRRWVMPWAGIALLCLGLLFALSGVPRRRKDRLLTFDNEGGAVSINTQAISDYISKLCEEFPSITRMTPRVIPGRNTVDIVVDIRVRAGPQINEVCRLLQQRVRESMTDGLGISEIRRIEVRVGEIASEHRRV